MQNNVDNKNIATGDILILSLLGIIFTAINIIYSSQYGRLSVPPTYDDIVYIKDGFILLDLVYQYGWGHLPFYVLTKTWHAPLEALQACLAFAIWGRTLWGPYLLNGSYLIALLIIVRKELSSVSISTFLAIAICILAWPLTNYLIAEFRPDIPTTLFLALGGWRLAKRSDEIGQGQYRLPQSLWVITWPFLLALWLKPSYSPVTVGLWLSAWVILGVMNRFVTRKDNALQYTLATFLKCSLILFLGFLPYLVVSGSHLVDYFRASVFSEGQETWSPPLTLVDNLKYYVMGGAGRLTMGWWSVVTFATAAIALLIATRARDYRALRSGGIYAALAFVAWLGMTILSNKSAWFGSVVSSYFIGVFLIALGYIIASLRKLPVIQYSLIAFLILLGLGLQSWPKSDGALPNLSLDELPAYSRESRRVFADTCEAIQDQSGGNEVSVLLPLISTVVNQDSVELCGIEKGGVAVHVKRTQMSKYSELLKTIRSDEESGKSSDLALIMSEDFPGIPGYLPPSKNAGSINQLFALSPHFKLAAIIRGPNGNGNIRVYKKRAAFTSLKNVTGMRGFEGPYPDKKLPMVRWTLFPSAEFDVPVTMGRRMVLTLAGLSATHSVTAKVQLSAGDTKQCEFGASGFADCKLEFSAQGDHVHVKLDFLYSEQKNATPAAGALAVLLSRVEVEDFEKGPMGSPQSISPFASIDFLDGFSSVEGPYPKHGLPVVVWGRGDISKIGIAGESRGGGVVSVEWRPGDAAVQAIDVLNQGKVIGHCMSGAQSSDFRRCQIDLPIGTTPSNLDLRYVGNMQILSNKMNNSALFKRISFVDKND